MEPLTSPTSSSRLVLGIIVGLVIGLPLGFWGAGILKPSSSQKPSGQEATDNPLQAVSENPLQDVSTNPYEKVKYNPFE